MIMSELVNRSLSSSLPLQLEYVSSLLITGDFCPYSFLFRENLNRIIYKCDIWHSSWKAWQIAIPQTNVFAELAYLNNNPVRPFVWSPRSTTMPDIWVGPVETAAHLKEKWFIAFSQSARRAGLPRKAVKVTVLSRSERYGRQGR